MTVLSSLMLQQCFKFVKLKRPNIVDQFPLCKPYYKKIAGRAFPQNYNAIHSHSTCYHPVKSLFAFQIQMQCHTHISIGDCFCQTGCSVGMEIVALTATGTNLHQDHPLGQAVSALQKTTCTSGRSKRVPHQSRPTLARALRPENYDQLRLRIREPVVGTSQRPAGFSKTHPPSPFF
jgi:hypothetical protein